MSSRRYFIIDGSPPVGETVTLGEEETHHLFRVVRAKPGDEVTLLDGKGGVYRGVLRPGKDPGAKVEIVSVSRADRNRGVDMALPLIKPHRMETAVEKCAELGIRRIIPFRCERSLWKGGEKEASRKVERLGKKVMAACKQSGNPWLTSIEPVVTFREMIDSLRGYEAAYLADCDGVPFPGAFDRAGGKSAIIGIVGPEGGFSGEERAGLISAGAATVSLGMNRLRSETSAILLAAGIILSAGRP